MTADRCSIHRDIRLTVIDGDEDQCLRCIEDQNGERDDWAEAYPSDPGTWEPPPLVRSGELLARVERDNPRRRPTRR